MSGKIISYIFMSLVLTSCWFKGNSGQTDNSYLIVTRDIIEDYDTLGLISKTVIDYEYENETDYFWKKANFKDSQDRVLYMLVRDFDNYRFPIIETQIDSLGHSKKSKVEYNKDNYELIFREEYSGEISPDNLIKSIRYNYNGQGYLFSSEIKEYCNDTLYKNIDGNTLKEHYTYRYLPGKKSVPKGFHEVLPFIEYHRRFYTKLDNLDTNHVGDLMIDEATSFNSDGFPFYYVATNRIDTGRNKEEWYKIEKDQENYILFLTTYTDKDHKRSNEKCYAYEFKYDTLKTLKSYEKSYYNKLSGKYDIYSIFQSYVWVAPEIVSKHDYSLANTFCEFYNSSEQKQGMYRTTIKKYDNVGECVIETYSDLYTGQYQTRKFTDKLVRRVTRSYNLFECDNKGGRIIRRK